MVSHIFFLFSTYAADDVIRPEKRYFSKRLSRPSEDELLRHRSGCVCVCARVMRVFVFVTPARKPRSQLGHDVVSVEAARFLERVVAAEKKFSGRPALLRLLVCRQSATEWQTSFFLIPNMVMPPAGPRSAQITNGRCCCATRFSFPCR